MARGEEVFLVATNQLEHNYSPESSLPAAQHASCVEKESDRLVVSTPAIGITLYDLRDQTPLASLTLGPAFNPSSPAVSRSEPSASADSIRVKSTRKTWVAVTVADAPEVWSWLQDERKDGSVEGEATKVVYPMPTPLVAILAPKSLPEHLVLLSSTGVLSLASESDINTPASLPPTADLPLSQDVHLYPIGASTSSLLPPSVLSLIPTSSKAHLAFVVRTFSVPTPLAESLVDISKKKFKKTKRPSSASVIEAAEAEGASASSSSEGVRSQVELALLDPEVMRDGVVGMGIVSLGKVAVPGSQVVVSEDGFVSALSATGNLESHRLSFSGSASFASVYADLFTDAVSTESHLSLTPLKSLALSSTALALPTATLLALHSSFVLLTAARPAVKSSSAAAPVDSDLPARIAALVWDVRLGALVSDSEVQVPSAAFPPATPKRHVRLGLSSVSRTAAALVVAPSTGPTGRSLVFVLPLSLPSASVLAAVVGKHALTKKYLAEVPESSSARAKRAEPVRHPKTSPSKLALLEASEAARSQLLDALEPLLAVPAVADAAIARAEELFDKFVDEERARLTEYNLKKMQLAEERENERREKAHEELDKVKTTASKFRIAKRRIEAAIADAGPDVPWTDVTAKRIKTVNDVLRYKYFELRKADEEKAGKEVDNKSRRHEKALKAIAKQEPTVPSSFVTAILRLCFPEVVAADSVLSSSKTSAAPKHPTTILKYLLDRSLVSDSLLPSGVTNLLARAGDWPNVKLALETMPDIPESTTVGLLKTVVAASSLDQIDVDSIGLPYPTPSLENFLESFVESPLTPATLRQALQQQLTALEVLPVLEVLDAWLGWWAAHGGGGGQLGSEKGADWKAAGRTKPKRLPTNPFVTLAGEGALEEPSPPRVEDIVPLVQGILDAHFVTLLLQRQSHRLLRRLSAHVAAHVAIQQDLASLLGALAIYSRAKEDQREAKDTKGVTTGFGEQQQKTLGASMAAKVAAQEKHAEVGEYQVDKFWL